MIVMCAVKYKLLPKKIVSSRSVWFAALANPHCAAAHILLHLPRTFWNRDIYVYNTGI